MWSWRPGTLGTRRAWPPPARNWQERSCGRAASATASRSRNTRYAFAASCSSRTPTARSSLCYALLRLAQAQAMAGHALAAWRTVLEGEELCRALTDRPGRSPEQNAFLLRQLAQALSLCGRRRLSPGRPGGGTGPAGRSHLPEPGGSGPAPGPGPGQPERGPHPAHQGSGPHRPSRRGRRGTNAQRSMTP